MNRKCNHHIIIRGLIIVYYIFSLFHVESVDDNNNNNNPPVSQLLALGDSYLSNDDPTTAIPYYRQGISSLTDDDSLAISLSLYTNLATALSSTGDISSAIDTYKRALIHHSSNISTIVDKNTRREIDLIAAQCAFFLGLSYEDVEEWTMAADAYAAANDLDRRHWASLGNLGAVLMDRMKKPAEALVAYNEAYEILTEEGTTGYPVTDPPAEPRFVLSQLQYRIGLAITYSTATATPSSSDGSDDQQHSTKKGPRKCTLSNDPERKAVPCNELAAHAFSMAVRYDDGNENAKHMLAALTADATVERASNSYVTELFESYASNFEHSLVSDLGYTGYERLRAGFDKAFSGVENVPMFPLVIDAGCGTGLAGEQFRNISQHLIGVDLSPSIINEAKKARPNLYDDTHVGDVTDIFKQSKGTINLIIAADSYIYFGDLVPLFEAMEEGLLAISSDDDGNNGGGGGGYAAFTLENVSDDNERRLTETTPEWRWQLTASGRFAHRREYVEAVAGQFSLEVVYYEAMDGFRTEMGVPVRGHLFVMRKKKKGGISKEGNDGGGGDGDEGSSSSSSEL